MIPKYKEGTKVIAKHLTSQMLGSFRENRGRVIPQLAVSTHHEGDGFGIKRDDGSVEVSGYSSVQTEKSMRIDVVSPIRLREAERLFREMGEEFGVSFQKSFWIRMDQQLKKHNRVVKGAVTTAESLLKAHEDLEVDFDEAGRPTTQIVCGPEMFEKMKAIAEEVENTPALKKKFTDLQERKRDEWARRASDRELAE
jgi:hypothetical protein